MGKTAETVIVRSFAYFSRFPPQFSPCENCAPIVQTTLWNYIRPCSASHYRTSFFTYIMPAPLSTAAETSAVLSFAYLSQFPPQFSPCENCALIVQTTLWHFSSLVPPLPLQNKFFFTYITLDPLSIAVRPVLTYSRMPNGSRSFIKLSILSSLPVASTITESTSTSTMCAR